MRHASRWRLSPYRSMRPRRVLATVFGSTSSSAASFLSVGFVLHHNFKYFRSALLNFDGENSGSYQKSRCGCRNNRVIRSAQMCLRTNPCSHIHSAHSIMRSGVIVTLMTRAFVSKRFMGSWAAADDDDCPSSTDFNTSCPHDSGITALVRH